MNDVELLKIGQRYIVDGKFNYGNGNSFTGTLAAVSPNFLGWTDCERLSDHYGKDQTNFVTNIRSVGTCAPVEE